MIRRLVAALAVVTPLAFATTAAAQYVPYDEEENDQPASTANIDTPLCFEEGENRDVMLEHVLEELGVTNERSQAERFVDWYEYVCNGVWIVLTADEVRKLDDLDIPGLTGYTYAGRFELPVEPVDMADMTGRGYDYSPQILTPASQRVGVVSDGRNIAQTVGIGIIDTGVDMLHDDLNVVAGYDCTFHDPGPHGYEGGWGNDSHGHATHVAGSAAAEDNDRFIEGPAAGADIISLKVFGSGGSASYAQVMCGMDKALGFALDGVVDVINMSLGGSHAPSVCGGVDVYHNATCALAEVVPVIVAAGNDGIDAVFKSPAAFPEVVTVSALTDGDGVPGRLAFPSAGCGFAGEDDALAPFSNYGSAVDFIAPGVCILSLLPGNQAGYMSGTSMATPVVAGVFAEYIARCGPDGAVEAITEWSTTTTWLRNEGQWTGDVGPDHEPLVRVGAPCV